MTRHFRDSSVIVPVTVMGRVAVAVVDVVHVVSVGNGHVTAALAVRVIVTGVLAVRAGFALVRVPLVLAVQVAVVHVVDVTVVRDRHVTAALTVRVFVPRMRLVLH